MTSFLVQLLLHGASLVGEAIFLEATGGFFGDGALHQSVGKGWVDVSVAEASAVLQEKGVEDFGIGEGAAICQQNEESSDVFSHWCRDWRRDWWRD